MFVLFPTTITTTTILLLLQYATNKLEGDVLVLLGLNELKQGKVIVKLISPSSTSTATNSNDESGNGSDSNDCNTVDDSTHNIRIEDTAEHINSLINNKI